MYRSVIFALSVLAIMAVNLTMAGGPPPPPPSHNQWLQFGMEQFASQPDL